MKYSHWKTSISDQYEYLRCTYFGLLPDFLFRAIRIAYVVGHSRTSIFITVRHVVQAIGQPFIVFDVHRAAQMPWQRFSGYVLDQLRHTVKNISERNKYKCQRGGKIIKSHIPVVSWLWTHDPSIFLARTTWVFWTELWTTAAQWQSELSSVWPDNHPVYQTNTPYELRHKIIFVYIYHNNNRPIYWNILYIRYI